VSVAELHVGRIVSRRVALQSHSAHHTEQVTVHYPWHPLHGQTLVVQRSVRNGREVWLCEHDQRTAAIPVWMTDRVACAALSIGRILVSIEALDGAVLSGQRQALGARSRHRSSAPAMSPRMSRAMGRANAADPSAISCQATGA